jgi:ribosomal protein S4
MYRLRLNTRKIFCSSFGNYKKKQLTSTIKKSDNRGLSLKIKNLYFNNHTLNSVKNSYDSLLYVMHAFDSKLIVSLFRLGNFKSIFLAFFSIRRGFIEVDGRVIKNPYYVLKNLSIISIKYSFISKYLNKLKLMDFKFYKKRRKYSKTIKVKSMFKVGKRVVRVKPIKKKRIFYHSLRYLLLLQSAINIKYVYVKPKFSELDGRSLFN